MDTMKPVTVEVEYAITPGSRAWRVYTRTPGEKCRFQGLWVIPAGVSDLDEVVRKLNTDGMTPIKIMDASGRDLTSRNMW